MNSTPIAFVVLFEVLNNILVTNARMIICRFVRFRNGYKNAVAVEALVPSFSVCCTKSEMNGIPRSLFY